MPASIDAIRKSNRSVSNRIQSILEDTEFVDCVASTYAKPVVPNKRCGLWYVPPTKRAAEACFKSTDGHTGQWGFSLKRLNLHLIPLIELEGGCVLVDSTRRGKRMPDAFSKTIPIWCAVLNCALLGMDPDSAAHFPRSVVSASEADQIKAQIPGWARQFKDQVPKRMQPHLSRPLRPIWVTPDAPLPAEPLSRGEAVFPDASAVILCTASRQAQDGELYMGFTYIQGAADDHELWAPKSLVPELLFSNSELQERGISDAELNRRIEAAIAAAAAAETPVAGSSAAAPSPITQANPMLAVAHGGPAQMFDGDLIDLRPSEANQWGLTPGKKGARELAAHLEAISTYFANHPGHHTIVSGLSTDFAEAVALMLDCKFFDETGQLLPLPQAYVSKDLVTKRNMSIIAMTGQAPSRTTQNIIGAYLRGSTR